MKFYMVLQFWYDVQDQKNVIVKNQLKQRCLFLKKVDNLTKVNGASTLEIIVATYCTNYSTSFTGYFVYSINTPLNKEGPWGFKISVFHQGVIVYTSSSGLDIEGLKIQVTSKSKAATDMEFNMNSALHSVCGEAWPSMYEVDLAHFSSYRAC